MATFTLPIAKIKASLVGAVDELISKMGETITYTFYDGTAAVTIRAVRKKLREEELVGDYEQGDVRITIDATTMPQAPAKYDEVTTLDGHVYAIIDYIASDVGLDDTILIYRVIGRG